MSRRHAMFLLVVGFAAMASAAEAAKYTCKAAKELARLGARDSDTVVVDPDDAKKECRFSVNGEPAASPPRGAVIQGLNVLRSGVASVELAKNNVDWLAALLLAASRDTAVSSSLRQQISASAGQLAKCFDALEKSFKDFAPFVDKDIFCRVLPSGGEVSFDGANRVEVQSTISHLVIGVRRQKDASFLFIPFDRFRGPALQ